MILILVVGLSMALADTGQGAYVMLMARHRKFLAGLFDGLSDVFLAMSVVGAGTTLLSVHTVGGSVSFDLHVTWVAVCAQMALICGSVAGAAVGDIVADRLSPPDTTVAKGTIQ